MNISGASITVSSEDIKSIIEDFVKVPGLTIEGISVDKQVSLSGAYKKFVRIPFKVSVSIVSIKERELELQIEKIQLGKISVFKWIRDFALSKFMKTLKEYGIHSEKGKVKLRLEEILKQVPVKLNFSLNALELYKDKIHIEVKKINIDISGQAVSESAVLGESKDTLKTIKTTVEGDKYNELREDIENKVPDKFKGLLPYVMILPDIFALFIRLFKDKRVPLKAKIICGSIITYFALPIDILPDFLPIVGKIDDLALAFFALDKLLCEVPEQIIKDNWAGKEDIIVVIRKGIDLLYKTIGTNNLVKGYSWVAKALKGRKNSADQAEIKENNTNGKEVLCD